MIIESVIKQALAPRHTPTGEELAVGRTTKTGDWVLLQPVDGRPGYKQLRLCAPPHAQQLEELNRAGVLQRAPVEGLGCDIVTLAPLAPRR